MVLLGLDAFLARLVFVELEVLGLLGEDAAGLVGEVFAALDGFFSSEVEGGFAGESTENPEPAWSCLSEGLEGGSQVGFAVSILVEVVAELVEEGGKVLEFVVEAPGTGLGLGAVGKALDDVGVCVEELGVEGYAEGWIDAGVANLLELCFGEGLALLFLR